MSRRSRQHGIVLPIVLMLAALLLALVVTSLDAARSQARIGANLLSRIQAFHAADAVVRLCDRRVRQERRIYATIEQAAAPGLPQQWRTRDAFEGPARKALEPMAAWPNVARAPQCLIERWQTPVAMRQGLSALNQQAGVALRQASAAGSAHAAVDASHATNVDASTERVANDGDTGRSTAYLITGRGFGASEETQVWLQTLIVIDETGHVDREWRTIAGRPF
jgi:Tfp pilus assembly protein PilX